MRRWFSQIRRWFGAQLGPILAILSLGSAAFFAAALLGGFLLAAAVMATAAILGTLVTLAITQLFQNQVYETLQLLQRNPGSHELRSIARESLAQLPLAEQIKAFERVVGSRGMETFRINAILSDREQDLTDRISQALTQAFSDRR
ncbi:hypothetical protein [Frankia sp. Cas4]|uniref:hypothetical protein n=1 Tax=Frankia sp. Cas4 TaxID=3073927 RepID=UPI002AD51207|nr:hypothetical protein [Frankia sp. Cas4]